METRSKTQIILDLVEKHEQYRVRDCLNLRADENYSIPASRKLLGSDFGHRNTSPDPRFKYRGTDYMVQVGDLAAQMGKELFKANYINFWCPTGHAANIMVYFALCRPGDKVMVLGTPSGGYGGMAAHNLPGYLGLRTLTFPFDLEKMNIDVEKTIELIKKEQPRLVIFGATYFLFPHPIEEIARAVHAYGGVVAYDGAHVLGLIACGQFQDPLREGADIVFGSTMKTFAGPGGGVTVTNSAELDAKLTKACFYGAVTATLWNRIAALGVTFDYLLTEGRDYAARVVNNAQTLAKELEKQDIPLMCRDQGYTQSHMILLDLGGMDKNVAGQASDMSIKLEKANIIIDDRGRIGLSEVSRIGMNEQDMAQVAHFIARAAKEQGMDTIRQEICAFKQRFL